MRSEQMRLACGAAALAMLTAGAGTSQAAFVEYGYEAFVSFIIPSAVPPEFAGVQNGDRFTLRFKVNTAVGDAEWRTWWGVYPGAVSEVRLDVPTRGISRSYEATTTLNVSDGRTQFQSDEVRWDLPLGGGPTIIFWLRANSLDGVNAPSVLTGDQIPALSEGLSEWNFTRSIGVYHNAGQGGPGNYSIFTGNAQMIPEPAAAGLLAAALPALSRRRRR